MLSPGDMASFDGTNESYVYTWTDIGHMGLDGPIVGRLARTSVGLVVSTARVGEYDYCLVLHDGGCGWVWDGMLSLAQDR